MTSPLDGRVEELTHQVEALRSIVAAQQQQVNRQKCAILEVVDAVASLDINSSEHPAVDGAGPSTPRRRHSRGGPGWDASPGPQYERFRRRSTVFAAGQQPPRNNGAPTGVKPLAVMLQQSQRLNKKGQTLRGVGLDGK